MMLKKNKNKKSLKISKKNKTNLTILNLEKKVS